MSVNEELVEKGAKALRDDTAYASSYARKVLEAVLPDIETQLLGMIAAADRAISGDDDELTIMARDTYREALAVVRGGS